MSNIGDLKVAVSVDLSQANPAFAKLRKDAEATGNAAAKGLGTLESKIKGVNSVASSNALERYGRQIEAMRAQTDRLQGSFDRVTGGATRFLAALGGLAAARSLATSFIQMSDSATRLEGRLRLVTSSSQELTKVQRELFDISQRTRSELGSNVELYTRSAQALKQLGATSEQTLRLTETLNQAFAISGATSAEASNALIQLSQALASGVLRGEEFNSISEQGPRIMQALADALGKTRGELRKMAEEGQLTSKLVFDALLSQAPKIGAEFAKVPRTVGQAMTQLGNDMLMLIDNVNKSTSATANLVSKIDELRRATQSTEAASAIAAIIGSTLDSFNTAKQVAEDVIAVYNGVRNEFAAIDRDFQAIATTFNGVVDGFVSGFNTITGASAEGARLFPVGWYEAVSELHNIIYDGVQRVVATLAAIPAAGHAAREALLGNGFAETFAREQQHFIDLINGAGSAVGNAVGFQVTLDEIVVSSNDAAVALQDATNATADLRSNAAIVTPVLEAVAESNDKAAKAAERYAKAERDRIRGINDTVAGLQMQIQSLGMTEGAAAALEFQYTALEAAKRAASEAGRTVSDEEMSAISNAAVQVEQLTNEYKSLNEARQQAERLSEFQADLNFGSQIRSLSEEDQRIAERLRAVGIDYLSVQGKQLGAQIRFNEEFKKTNDTVIDFQDIGESAFDILNDSIREGTGLLGGFANVFAKLANQLASKAFGQLFGGLFNQGQGQQSGNSIFGGSSATNAITSIGNALGGARGGTSSGSSSSSNMGSSSFGSSSTYGYNGGISQASFSALNDNLRQTSRSAIDVARQFNGLNEKANAPVLDSFLRASGNWNKLSAADTAWCAAFANAAIVQAGGKGTGSNLASSFMNWGQGTNAPKPGDIVVLKPQSAGASGHVGFLAGFENGKVQIFGGNQSHAANTQSYGLDQVRGYRTGAGLGNNTRADVSAGVIDATRKISNGQAGPSLAADPWSGLRTVTGGQAGGDPWSGMRGATNGMQSGGGLFGGTNGWTGGGSILGVQYPAFSAMGGISAGLGGFGAGYSSGSPISGGLTGALSGFMSGGPVGAIIGGVAGLAGGIFGGRAQRKEEHKKKAAAWEEMRPQFEAFDKSLSGEGTGQLREWITGAAGQLEGFMKVAGEAWKMGKGNDQGTFIATGTKMFARFQEMMDDFVESFAYTLEDLSSGEGLEGAFAKGRNAVRALDKQIDGFIDDVSIAFGSEDLGIATSEEFRAAAAASKDYRDQQIALAKQASGEYALSLLYTGRVVSDVQNSLEGFRGTAAGLVKVLTDLGWTAEKAASDIDERLSAAIAEMGRVFTDGFERDILDMEGKGYFNDITDQIKAYETALKDAALLGVDIAPVDKWFKLAAQQVVDGAELTGEAFDELIAKFPILKDLVTAFVAEADKADAATQARTIAQNQFNAALTARDAAEAKLRSAYEAQSSHLTNFSKQIKEFLTDIRLDEATSPLSNYDRFLEAQKQFRETQAKALSGDKEAQEALVGVSQEYLDEAKQYYASSESYYAAFREVETTLKNAESSAVSQLDQLKASVRSLINIDEGVASVEVAIKEMHMAIADLAKAMAAVNSTRDWGTDVARNQQIVAQLGQAGFNYSGDFGNGQFAQWVSTLSPSDQAKVNQIAGAIPIGGGTGVVGGNLGQYPVRNQAIMTALKQVGLNYTGGFGAGQFGSWVNSLPASQRDLANSIASQYTHIMRQHGGMIPEHAGGGYITNGAWNRDSVKATLAGGEHITRAPSVNTATRGMLDYINRNGALPRNDNNRMDGVERKLDNLTKVVAMGLNMNVAAVQEGNSIAGSQAEASKLAASR